MLCNAMALTERLAGPIVFVSGKLCAYKCFISFGNYGLINAEFHSEENVMNYIALYK